ncbi:hypothetical protein JYB62_02315 [Algoriphagus lutimaris]|uniref:hypothetical protein n=1 Tax=Algoriphagus lutimaris TaxID=613197 RepID=UPI00196A2E96|nr:hypothetical protein [Algoriphagus lutimaris]MBN3518824.1 hypothetical protein [Algoriphagus lutimaris]
MKILVISYNFGKTSSGKATERIVDGLINRGHVIEVICGQNYVLDKPYTIHRINPHPLSPSRFFKFVGNFIGKEINYLFWQIRAKKKGVEIIEKLIPDVIYSRGSPISSMIVGEFLRRKYNLPHSIHFADPIPPTLDWMNNSLERKKLMNTINPIIKNAGSISFVTEEMSKYQFQSSNILNSSKYYFVSPNPLPDFVKFGKPTGDKFIFLFLGTFAAQRNPSVIINAFLEFSSVLKNVEFHIYGNSLNQKIFRELNLSHKSIKFFDSSNNVLEIMRNSNVLVDVDADVLNQVFISGKLMEYIAVNRFILSISPINSPTSNLLKGMEKSIVSSTHNFADIVKSMSILYNRKWDNNLFSERELLKEFVGFNSVIDRIERSFSYIIDINNG